MKLLVLDGNSILNRAFYGIRLLTTKGGLYTNGIYGFINIYLKLIEENKPDYVAVAFDLPAPTFRHIRYDQYKAHRKGMPEELAGQMPILKELLDLWGIPRIEKEGYEADDILGTLADLCQKTGNECIIATGDRDSFQLVGNGVTVRLAKTQGGKSEAIIYDEAKIKEDYNLSPHQLIDVKALMGDSSDNIPGVAGIGEKGALGLICKFGSLDNVYENISSTEIKDSMRQKLEQGREIAYISQMLATIERAVPISLEIEDYCPKEPNKSALLDMMRRLEFFTLISKLGLDQTDSHIQEETTQTEIKATYSDPRELIKILAETGKADFIAKIEDNTITSLAFSIENEVQILCREDCGFIEWDTFLNEFMNNPSIRKRTHYIKALYHSRAKIEGIQFDSLLAAYLLSPSSTAYDLPRLFSEYNISVPKVQGVDESLQEIATNAAAFTKLADFMQVQIDQFGQTELLLNIEIPLAKVLADMETAGFFIEAEGLQKYGEKLELRLNEIKTEIINMVGYEFNINSPKQMGEALFEKLGLPAKKKTTSGYSTDVEVLEGLRGTHPVIDFILEYRQTAKLKSTYADGLLKVISTDGRIHTNFNQTETRTGRISSTEPNLQNIPVRQELGRELRRFFIAKEGCILLDADYSQIELRVLAHIADDKQMINAFINNEDIHTLTASEVFDVPLQMVTSLMRSRAKAVNFGIVYGIGAFSLSKDIGVTRGEADKYIKEYFETYPGVKEYMDKVVIKAKEDGYVSTMLNRRRLLPELGSSNGNLRNFGERVARNMPIQGTAADIIKIAMIRVQNRLINEGLSARLILQVHDELIVEAAIGEEIAASKILKEEMEGAITMKSPLVAEVHSGRNWLESK